MLTKNSKKFEFTLSRIGLTLFILGMSGLLFGVFLFGVMMGKNIDTYPEKIARFLPDNLKTRLGLPSGVQESVLAGREDRNQEAPPATDEDPELTYFNRLGKHKAEAGGTTPEGLLPKKAPAAGADGHPAQAVQVFPKPATLKPDPVPVKPVPIKPVAPQKTPATVQKAPSSKEPVTKTSGQTKYVVQVVSYQEKEKADGLVKKISALGYPARTEVTELPGKKKWFRVLMGTFSGRAEADKAIAALSKSNKGLNCVVRSVEGK